MCTPAGASVIEVGAVIGLAAASALWKLAFDQGTMRRGMDAILREVQLLRTELTKDIRSLQSRIEDHEIRLREVEKR